jgi:hypothetical protein
MKTAGDEGFCKVSAKDNEGFGGQQRSKRTSLGIWVGMAGRVEVTWGLELVYMKARCQQFSCSLLTSHSNSITAIYSIITTTKMQFLTLLATAAFAAFATALLNRLAPRGDPPAEGGSFKDHCCTSAS